MGKPTAHRNRARFLSYKSSRFPTRTVSWRTHRFQASYPFFCVDLLLSLKSTPGNETAKLQKIKRLISNSVNIHEAHTSVRRTDLLATGIVGNKFIHANIPQAGGNLESIPGKAKLVNRDLQRSVYGKWVLCWCNERPHLVTELSPADHLFHLTVPNVAARLVTLPSLGAVNIVCWRHF